MSDINVNGSVVKCYFQRNMKALLPLVLFMNALPAIAGAPYVTDDPGVQAPGHLESLFFSTFVQTASSIGGSALTLSNNLGVAEHTDLRLGLSELYSKPEQSNTTTFGFDDISLGLKYQVFSEPEFFSARSFAVAINPTVVLPAGTHSKGFGNSSPAYALPISVGESLGAFDLYGSVGYKLNTQSSASNSVFGGVALIYHFIENVAVGTEIFFRSKGSPTGYDTALFNVGLVYDVTSHGHFMFSAGRGLHNAIETNEASAFVGYKLTY